MFPHGSGKRGGLHIFFFLRPTEIYQGEFTTMLNVSFEDRDEFVNLKLYGSQGYSNAARNE